MQVSDDLRPAWIPLWQVLPPIKREVAILVVLSDGSFKNDIGTYWGPGEMEGWTAQFWSERPRVVAWFPLPDQPAKGATP